MIIRSKLIPVAVLSLGLLVLAKPVSSAPSHADVAYATGPAGTPLQLDLYLPPSAGAPLLVWVHGGAWENGKWTSPPALVQFRNIFIKELK